MSTWAIGDLQGCHEPLQRLLERIRFDPATASVPLVTSVADIAGIVIYFTIAGVILGI